MSSETKKPPQFGCVSNNLDHNDASFSSSVSGDSENKEDLLMELNMIDKTTSACKLFDLLQQGNVDPKSKLHKGNLYKITICDKVVPISIPPYWVYANRGQSLSDLSF